MSADGGALAVSMMLPDELEWVLEMLGYNWPTADEDKLRDSAELWRKFGDDVVRLHESANSAARNVTAHNGGESIDAFTKTYAKFDNGGDGYLTNAAQAAYIIANVMEACAYIVEFAKWAVIAQLVALAIQIAAAQLAAPFTFGLSELGALGATQATRLIVRRLLDELKDALMEAIVEAMKEPAVSAIEAIITDLVRQTVNVGFGAQQGYDLSQTAKAGAQGGWEAIQQTPQTLAEGVRDSLGSKAGSHARNSVESRVDGYGLGSGTSGSDGGSGSSSGSSSDSSGSSSDSSSSSSSSSSNSGSSGSDSSASTRSGNGAGVNIGGGISADGGGGGVGAPDVGSGPSSDSGSGSASGSGAGQNPSASDAPAPRPTPSLSGPTLSDFDDPAPGGTQSGGSNSGGSSGTPSTSGPSHTGGGPSVSSISSPAAQSAPAAAPSGGTSSSSPGGGAIGTSIDSLAATVPTQSNAAPTPTATDPSSASTGGRTDGGSTAPTSPVAPSTGGGVSGSHQSASAAGGTPSATSPTSPTPNSSAARNPSASTAGTPSSTGTGPASTPSPTSPATTPGSTPTATPDGRTPGTDGRTPSTPATPDGRIPAQRTPGTTQGDGSTPRNTPGTTPGDRTTPRNTPGTPPGDGTAHRNTPGSTPGDRTSSRTSPDPSGTRTSTPGQNPSTSTPTTTPSTSTGTGTGTGTDRASTPSSSNPNSATRPGQAQTPSTPSTPNTSGTPGTQNQPSAGTPATPTRPPQQPAGSTPNTPNTPQQPAAQPHTPQNTPPNPQQQQHQQVTAVPIHTVVTTPSSSTPPPHAAPATPHPPGSPQATPGDPNHQQQPQQDGLEDIRSDLDHYPGGLSEPDPADQQALVDAVPRNEDGTPERFPDPFGSWSQLQNDGGIQVPGRSNNCADCSRSFLETWYGNPQVSAARTPDYDENGNHDPFTPEDNANDNQIRWTGAAHTYAGPGGDPATADNIASVLQQAGPGSAAIVQVDWPNGGGGHAFNVVNHNGNIVWIDTQSGEVSNEPLHIDNAEHVWHIPLDADRNPIDLTQSDAGDSEHDSDTPQEETGTSQPKANDSAQGNQDQEASQSDTSGEKPDGSSSENSDHSNLGTTADDPSATDARSQGHTEEGTPPADIPRSDGLSTGQPSHSTQAPDATGSDKGTRTGETSTLGPRTTDPDPAQRDPSPTDHSGNADTRTLRDNAVPSAPHAAPNDPTPDRGAPQQTPVPEPTPSTPADRPTSGTPIRPNPGDTPPTGRHTTTNQPTETPGSPHRRGPEEPAGQKPDNGKKSTDSKDATDEGKDPNDPPYSDPHDRGTSDTSDQSRSVTHDGPESDVSRTHEREDALSREYGIEPDALQQSLRTNRSVHRVDLDRVHHQLQTWTKSGELAHVLQMTSGAQPHPNGPKGPRLFTRSQLEDNLDGFSRLSPGEQQAVVASLARLSLSFHQQHSVGRSPEPITNPYRQPGESDPAPGTRDRGAKMSKQSLGVRLHRMAVNKLFRAAEYKKLPEDEAKKLRRQAPDLTDKNFAVLEVEGPDGVTYVVDSSVPPNTPGVSPRHSERHLLEWLERVDPKGDKYKPLGLYTEREPCGTGRGHAKCSEVLLDQRLAGVPIHYSTTYRQDPAGVEIRDALLPEKAQALDAIDDLSDQGVKEELERRVRDRLKENSPALPKNLKDIEDLTAEAARKRLENEVANEYDAIRKATKTDEERAMIAEMTRHMEALEEIWGKLRPQLVN
ncbi:toxin glutamine deamidase domain-containing protein [Streptomyces acidicola]|uniref:Uncharacterized protein n=1 Tax=Streptomyces acidicola TaxID=2596892 RepID=A0A5N8WQC0_9ACTN|nr:toxin glutamine deamidase domain-containing protein [Streptomyces acidicola]MPY49036.1 hypothetical protein [Streptomyces acidicola]